MRYIKKLILILIIVPINTYAIDFYCDRNVKSGEQFSCIISNPSNSLYSFNATLDYSTDITITKTSFSNKYNGKIDKNVINITGPGYNAPTTMAVLIMKAPQTKDNKNYKISLTNIKYKLLETETTERTIDNPLNYTITVKGDGISTTSKIVKHYLTINHNQDNISDSRLECIEEDNKCTIDLSNVYIYPKEGYTFTGYSETIDCTNLLSNTYNIDKDKTIYACYKQEEEPSTPTNPDSIYITNIKINGITDFTFLKDKYEYNIYVPEEYNKISLNIETEEDIVTEIKGDINNLKEGLNTIEVIARRNSLSTTYKLNINKGSIITDNLKLSNINIKGYKINFNKDQGTYNLKVKYNTKKLEITPTLENDNTYYDIIGNNSLEHGGKIDIIVKETNDISNTYSLYTIKITTMTFIETYLYYIYVASFSLFCLIVYFIVKFLRSDKYKELKNKKKEPKQKKEKVKKTKEKKEKIEKL